MASGERDKVVGLGDLVKELIGLCENLPDIGLALDLNLHARVYQPLHFDESRGRPIVAEIRDTARIDLRSLGYVGHKHLNLNDVLSAGTGRFQALVHYRDRDVELGDDICRDAAVWGLTNNARNPDV